MLLAGNPVLQAARDYWCGLPKPVNIPDFRLINPIEIPRVILPHVVIVEVTNGNFDFGRIRLCGHEIARWFREMPEGLDAADYAAMTSPAYIRHLRDLQAELIQRRRPLYCQSIYTLPGEAAPDVPPDAADGGTVVVERTTTETIVTAERLVLPLADGATAVECVILVETLSASGAMDGPLPLLPPAPGVTVTHGPIEPVE